MISLSLTFLICTTGYWVKLLVCSPGCLANTLREFSLSNQDKASSREFWLRTGVRAGHIYVFKILCWFWRLRITGLSGKGQTMGIGWAEYYYCCLVAQSWPTLCYPMDCALPGSSMHGISQTVILEWIAISYSRGSSWPRDWTCISCTGRWIPYHCTTWEARINRHKLLYIKWASLVARLVKNPPAMRETWAWSLGWEDPLEEGKATYSSILAWRIPWTV